MTEPRASTDGTDGPQITEQDLARAMAAFEHAVQVVDSALRRAARWPASVLALYNHDPDGPEIVGPFRVYGPADIWQREGDTDHGWAVSYGPGWLPGRYADRNAALLACGYVLGGETHGDLEVVRDRAGGRLITVEDLTGLSSREPGRNVAGSDQAGRPSLLADLTEKATRTVVFRGGPWDGQQREQPAVLAPGQHCMPRKVIDDELGETWAGEVWAAADAWPGQQRYRPVELQMDTGALVMMWSLAEPQEIEQAVQERGRRLDDKGRDTAIDDSADDSADGSGR